MDCCKFAIGLPHGGKVMVRAAWEQLAILPASVDVEITFRTRNQGWWIGLGAFPSLKTKPGAPRVVGWQVRKKQVLPLPLRTAQGSVRMTNLTLAVQLSY